MKLFVIILLVAAFQTDCPCLFEGEGFIGYIFPKEHAVYVTIQNQKERYTPSVEDISRVEEILRQKLSVVVETPDSINVDEDNGCPVIANNLNNYDRQYFGFLNTKGEKIVWVNCVWKNNFRDDIGKELIFVYDGCSYFWNVKVNMETEDVFDWYINPSG